MNNHEVVSDRQAISLIVLFIIGESSIFIEGIVAKKDLWLSIVLAIIVAVPLFIIFARLHSLYLEKDFFDIMEVCLGKYFGKFMIALYTWFAFHTTTLILEDLGFFVRTVLFPETPFIVPIIFFALACAFCVRQGIEVMGRYAEFMIIIPIVAEIIIVLLLVPKMNIDNIRPILFEGLSPFIKGAFLTLTFPFAYVVGLTMCFKLSKAKNNPYRIYIVGLIIGGIIVLITSTTDLLVVGEYVSSILYYPTYSAVSRIKVGEFLQRLEIFAAGIFLIGIYIEVNAFLLGACKGIAKLFSLSNYRVLVLPVTALIIAHCTYEFNSIMHYFEFGLEVWPYYVFPFEVIFPIIIWVIAEVRAKRNGGHNLEKNN